MQKLAILGGTFNPVHWGHLVIAETALSQFSLDAVIWVPAYYPPHRAQQNLLDFHHRLEMVRLAIATHPQFRASDLEQSSAEPSYAIDTLAVLQAQYSQSQWYWIVGLDTFQSLPRWYRRQDIAKECHWLVAPRTEEMATAFGSTDKYASTQHSAHAPEQQVVHAMEQQNISLHWSRLSMPLIALSSSLVRQYRRDRRSIRYLVPDSVRSYILQRQLYL